MGVIARPGLGAERRRERGRAADGFAGDDGRGLVEADTAERLGDIGTEQADLAAAPDERPRQRPVLLLEPRQRRKDFRRHQLVGRLRDQPVLVAQLLGREGVDVDVFYQPGAAFGRCLEHDVLHSRARRVRRRRIHQRRHGGHRDDTDTTGFRGARAAGRIREVRKRVSDSVRSVRFRPPCPPLCELRDSPSPLVPLTHAFEDPRRPHPAADAHRHHAVARRAPPHLVQQRRRQLRAGAAERMAERDGAAVDVQP